MTYDRIGVHTSHCCWRHNCKYGEKTCPVWTGQVKQDHPCEFCDEAREDLQDGVRADPEVAADVLRDLGYRVSTVDVTWLHCSPQLLASGVDCATTARRPCTCPAGGSHDHLTRRPT